MEQAKIKLIRTSQSVNSGRKAEIYIDDKLKTKISNGSEKIIKVSSGKHTVLAKIDWCKSQKITLNLEPGEKKKLICGSKLVGWKKWLALFYLFSKNKFIYLEHYSKEQKVNYQEETWSKLKEKGILYYIFKYGILSWGVPTGIFVFIAETIFNYNQISFPGIIFSFIITISIFSVGGTIFGLIMWLILNKISD
ncbi:hypothetical protein [Sporohalobacter salinus]|uniref:hypothetical protein n=1 Tax=Sporohalobacter salinus TaxID=1494606 RepID=UPI001961C851|nr:hypothetical protein [Sporohalobacter salinus]MBM7624246.1 hypothetical protein [Sporohalobacter salinus]